MFNSEFNEITGNYDNYYPKNLQKKIDEMNDYIYENINNGVYKVGFSTNQDVYESEIKKLFDALNNLEDILAKNKYLIGDIITEADWRLFTTIIRFDNVYYGHFKCNIKRIYDYPNLSSYLKKLYHFPKIIDTVKMLNIKNHYYQSHKNIN
jgi:glutathionyl-hydroquinone reductase